MPEKFKDFDSPLIIIAAARSGTKMLRSALACSTDLVDFPYDMNYIWKYGNYQIPHDELTASNLTKEINRFIQKRFYDLLKSSNAKMVLEKSVSNSLRVSFVRAVFPKCKIIHLYRDGRDVAVDALECWRSGATDNRIQSKRDLLRKIKDFPYRAAFPYLLTYLKDYAERLFRADKQLKSWGPRFRGIDDALGKYSLIEVCGMQWARSVDSSVRDLAFLSKEQDYISVKYEDLVANPVEELSRIIAFCQIEDSAPILQFAKDKVTMKFVNVWKEKLSPSELHALLPHIASQLKILGY